MNLIPVGVTVAGAAALRLLVPVLVQSRSLGGFIANVTVEEHHEDELDITEHPVEDGAAITDHAYKRPARLTVKVGYSNSSLVALGNPNYVKMIYSAFRRLQASVELLTVLTGKQLYQNMLIRRLTTTTDEKSENALVMTVELQQVIITSTQTINVPPAAAQGIPQTTVPVVPTAPQTLAPVPAPFDFNTRFGS